ncbi:hypothetical protein FDI69_gp183 [Rhodococcus phage Trina]|uniref:Uncharacterized protein n=1 Tax=Rhodococcus phage Trina TaxID=2027905 RepID=A0A2D0ZWU1_9CAUD|nr:hypothetical protein FDI69_gp183 [Rhodococcus phage Trina]ASZ75003.1 hypothetical protein SEA_TRINA_224 [Rhodococcus phage Trina]
MNKFVVFYKEEGVIAIGTERAYGMDVRYFMEGIEYSATCEPEEYIVMHELNDESSY